MPYAMLVGMVAIAVGTIPTAYGVSPIISILVGSGILVGILNFFGRRAEA